VVAWMNGREIVKRSNFGQVFAIFAFLLFITYFRCYKLIMNLLNCLILWFYHLFIIIICVFSVCFWIFFVSPSHLNLVRIFIRF
jgi:hypothetical protein